MAVDDSGTNGTGTEGEKPEVKSGGEPGAETPAVVPVTALQAERAKRQEYQRELEALRKSQAEAAEAEAAKRGEFEKLYNEAAPYKAKFEELAAKEAARMERLKERNAERVEKLPEHLRALFPSQYDPEAQADWLDNAAKAAPQTFPAGTRTGGNLPTGGIPPECVAEAERLGKDPEYWFRTGWKKRKHSS